MMAEPKQIIIHTPAMQKGKVLVYMKLKISELLDIN